MYTKVDIVNNNKEKITPETPEVISVVDDLENTSAKQHTMEEINKSLKSTTSPVKRVRDDESNLGINRSRQGEARPLTWKSNIAKLARNSGKNIFINQRKLKSYKP